MTVQIISKSQIVSYNESDIISFHFEKERYTPYTFFRCAIKAECDVSETLEIRVYNGSAMIHDGSVDSVICEKKNGVYCTSVKSYGFSMLLGQNQSEPGIIGSPDLETIVTNNESIYGVTCESDTLAVNYVYIEDKTTLWNAVSVYAMKAYGNYPYIKSPNMVCCKPSEGKLRNYDGEKIVSVKKGVKVTNLISKGFTNDLEGNWSYSQTDTFAAERHITKYKYYARSNEWVYNLNNEILFNMNFADRGRLYYTFTYAGYNGEELMDRAELSYDGVFSLSDMEIDYIAVNITSKGVFTTISCYDDKYCNA